MPLHLDTSSKLYMFLKPLVEDVKRALKDPHYRRRFTRTNQCTPEERRALFEKEILPALKDLEQSERVTKDPYAHLR